MAEDPKVQDAVGHWPAKLRVCPAIASTHAAGVVITRDPVASYVPFSYQ